MRKKFLGLCMVVFVFCSAVDTVPGATERIRTFHGYVKDTDENTVPGATVAITAAYSFKNIVASTTTDEDGYYAFENEAVDYDSYIIISKDNYYTSYYEGSDVYGEDTLQHYTEKIHGVFIMSGDWGGWFVTNYFEWHSVALKVKQNGKKINGTWRSSSSGVGGKFWGTLDGNVLKFRMTSKRKLYTGGCKGKYRGIAIVGECEEYGCDRESFRHTFTGSSCEGETDDGRGYFYRTN